MNLLHTCFSRSWGGLEIQALEVAEQLRRRGHVVHVGCCPGSRLEQETVTAGLTPLPLNVTGYLHPLLAFRLARFLRTARIDLIHAHLSKDLATIVPAIDLSGRNVPLILHKRVGSYIRKRDLFHRYTFRRVSRVLAISEVIRRNVIETTPVPPLRVVTLHDAIDTARFSPQRADRAAVRGEFGFSEGDVVVGFVGRFSPGKGHEELLGAAQLLLPRFPHLRFLVVGEPSYGEDAYAGRIRDMAREMGLEERVLFAGFRRDVPDVMAAFDIFAFPSHAESFGVVLIEAMALERPVVATNCDGVVDIVVDGETGLLVPPRRADALAGALARFIEDDTLRSRFGRAGRQRVLLRFDQQRQIDLLEESYRSVVRPLPS
jgi:glycosyltransferase involved in cell wall biosynthesis